MKNPFSKVPFLFFLLPLAGGILLQYYHQIQYLSIAILFIGAMAIFYSFLLPNKKEFALRWVFGLGVATFIFGLGAIVTSYSQRKSEYTFTPESKVYVGVVTDTPQRKPKTIAYKVFLPEVNKQIVCYFQSDSLSKQKLQPGDEFVFYGKIQPFRNMGNPDEFDYPRYMYNQGFSGSIYVSNKAWISTGKVSTSVEYIALRCRQKIMDFYQSLGFNNTEYTILSALTLGYQDDLTDDIKQGFRTTGTVHVLSVSGLHVGIIYLMISFLLRFIRRGSKYYWLKPFFIIIILWFYAFITGLPPSVLRASAMLTVFCIAEIFEKKSNSMHALFIAAFFILLVNPFSLFDIGFQLSFMSVLAILYLQPKASSLIKISNKYVRYIWQMFTLSCVAQLATFPICLYYFGTFPTYFFITNLLIVPLVSFIIYSVGGIILAKVLATVIPNWSYEFFYIPVKILQMLVQVMNSIIHFFEGLPFALIDNIKISLLDLTLIFLIIISLLIFIIYRKTKVIIITLTSVLIFIVFHTYTNVSEKGENLIVYNRTLSTEIKYKNENIKAEDIGIYKIISLRNKVILILSTNPWKEKKSDKKLYIDHLILTNDNSFSIYDLKEYLTIKNIVVDASLSKRSRNRISKECQNLNIPYHDVAENGAYSLIF